MIEADGFIEIVLKVGNTISSPHPTPTPRGTGKIGGGGEQLKEIEAVGGSRSWGGGRGDWTRHETWEARIKFGNH